MVQNCTVSQSFVASLVTATMVLRLGIDVGGTNTDAVLVQQHRVIASAKAHTTTDVLSGVRTAIHTVLQGSGSGQDQLQTCLTYAFLHAGFCCQFPSNDQDQECRLKSKQCVQSLQLCRPACLAQPILSTHSCKDSSIQAVWPSHTCVASFLRYACRYCLSNQGSMPSVER